MARLNGILPIEGTLQGMTFYKTQDGNLVKTKSGVSGDRIATEDTFARTRENGSEFGASATSGKLLRNTFRNLISVSSDNRVTSRVTQVMTQIKNLDTVNIRGERVVAEGISTDEGKAMLDGFNFNDKAILGAVLYRPFTVDNKGVITITGLMPLNDMHVPEGTTDISFSGAFGIIDFDGNTSDVAYTNAQNLPLDNTATDITLSPASTPTGKGISIVLLQISFYQEINKVQYVLNNGAYNTLTVIQVS